MTRKQARRLSAGALLLAQDRTGKLLRESVHQHVSAAAGRVARGGRKLEQMRGLMTTATAMAPALAVAIARGRKLARQAAVGRLSAELEATGQKIFARSSAAAKALEAAEEDEISARIVSESLASQWRQIARAAIALDREEDAAAAVRKTERAFASRLERAAVTEAARAFNDEIHSRLELAVKVGEVDPNGFWIEWNALVDACERCAPLHGERIRAGESFPGGEMPGSVHVHCRCTSVIVEA